jgi:hypothetical protein
VTWGKEVAYEGAGHRAVAQPVLQRRERPLSAAVATEVSRAGEHTYK